MGDDAVQSWLDAEGEGLGSYTASGASPRLPDHFIVAGQRFHRTTAKANYV